MFSILVVEDNENLNKMMSAKLKMETYNVFSAFNGEEALEVLEHEHIDLIISDVMMPGIDGFTLCKTKNIVIKTINNIVKGVSILIKHKKVI